MRIVLSIIAYAVLALAASAEEGTLLWQSQQPSGYVLSAQAPTKYCYETIRLVKGKRLYNAMECPGKPSNYFTLRIFYDAQPVQMNGAQPATRAEVKNGIIRLY
jgi:hypothetical protein